MRIGLLIVLFFYCISGIYAQISHGGIPPSFSITRFNEPLPTITMPNFNRDSMLIEDAKEEVQGTKAFRFAYNFKTDINLKNSGRSISLANGEKIWQIQLVGRDAYSLGLCFNKFLLPFGAELFIYNPSHSLVLGSFTEENNQKWGGLAISPLFDDTAIVELYIPAETKFNTELNIGRISQGYKDISPYTSTLKAYKSSGYCNVNINCPEGANWQTEKRAVAMIIASGWRLCSGSLINNANLDKKPYFLTAFHCLLDDDYHDVSQWVFMFNYESPECTDVDGNTLQTISGSTIKSGYYLSDFLLVELNNTPPDNYNVFYAGWDNTEKGSDTVVCIHHPKADIKKISIENHPVISSDAKYNQPPSPAGYEWHVRSWEVGTTEAGSSGSPLFNTAHRIIGQLHGGDAQCGYSYDDLFGKLSYSWPGYLGLYQPDSSLRVWLDPLNKGLKFLDGLEGSNNSIVVDYPVQYVDSAIHFSVLSTAYLPNSWLWDFGDGLSSTSPTPSHTYSMTGSYTVTSKITVGLNTIICTKLIKIIDTLTQACTTNGNYNFKDDSAMFYQVDKKHLGYYSGTNNYNYLAIAEKFNLNLFSDVPDKYLKEVNICFAKAIGDNVTIKVWDDSGPYGAPGKIIVEKSIPIASIVSENINSPVLVRFDNPVLLKTDFYVGMDINDKNKYLVLYTNAKGESANCTGYTQSKDSTWHLYTDTWTDAYISNAITPTICSKHSVNNIQTLSNTNLVLFPNPSRGLVNINIDISSPLISSTIKVYNSLGEMVKELASGSLVNYPTIDLSDLSNGYYLLRFQLNDMVIVKSLVIIK